MGNEYTRAQIKAWLDNAYNNRNKPNIKEKIKQKRQEKAKIVSKMFGF